MCIQAFRKSGIATIGSGLALLLCLSTPLAAAASDWEKEATVYIWGAQMAIETPNGHKAELPFYKILDTLQMTLMGEFAMRNDQWSFTNDLIYIDLQQAKRRQASGPDPTDPSIYASIGLKSWIVTPTVGYALLNSEKARVEIFGGLRYLRIEAQVRLDRGNITEFDESASTSYTDGVIGMRAKINLNEKWYMPLSADIGSGGSDGTWQAQAGLGYHFSKFDSSLTYRYLDYQFDDVPTMSSLVTKGLVASFSFKF